MTNHTEVIQQMIEANHGFVTATQVTAAGIPRRCLTAMVDAGLIYKVARGVYALPEVWEDELYILQYRFAKGIFSHETALYLHSMTDRTPLSYTMTFPFGYNITDIKQHGVIPRLATTNNYDLGITDVNSACNQLLKAYDIERTLCDILKEKHAGDIQVINQAMKLYTKSKSKDLAKLLRYAEQLRVKPKILSYMEILL